MSFLPKALVSLEQRGRKSSLSTGADPHRSGVRTTAMRIPDPPIDPARIAEFTRLGYWTKTTSNEALERLARESPDKLAIVDGRVRLGYGAYFQRAERLAAHLIGLGLGADDVVAI